MRVRHHSMHGGNCMAVAAEDGQYMAVIKR